MVFDFIGKIALVTGGASGIGLAYVRELLLNGCRGVSILDINRKLGNEIVQKFKREFGEDHVIFISGDVTNSSELEGAFQTTVDVFNNLDIVINNAAIFEEDDFETAINTNLTAVVRGTKLALQKFLPLYKSGDEGVIVNQSSVGALTFFASSPMYVSTKLGVVMLGVSLGSDYENNKIRVLTVCPGPTQTPMLSVVLKSSQIDQESLHDTFDVDSPQPADKVGKEVIEVIKKGKSGSIWVVDKKPAYEVYIKPII